jgi:catechol 2,3-dioxygenase-like lactoylglutathione lyase family enzyme
MRPTCTHIAIFARDIDRSVGFYRRYADLHEAHRRVDGGVSVVWLAESGRDAEFVIVVIEADHADPVDPAPIAHIGYSVGSRAIWSSFRTDSLWARSLDRPSPRSSACACYRGSACTA